MSKGSTSQPSPRRWAAAPTRPRSGCSAASTPCVCAWPPARPPPCRPCSL